MDRKITPEHNNFRFFKEFEYLDLFPYSIALLLLLGEVYILSNFVNLMHLTQQSFIK